MLYRWWLKKLIVYRIFSLYQENTKTIHLIMMIWLVNFIISNYKLASSPPKDPGGIKNIFSNQRTLIHRIFSVKANYQTRFQMSGICAFILCALSATRNCVFSCQKGKKIGMRGMIWWDTFREVHGEQFCIKNCSDSKTKVREKKLLSYQAFLGRRGRRVVKVTIIQTDFNCLVLREAFCVAKFLKSVAN